MGVSVHDRALAELPAAFRGKTVLVVGDAILDEYVWGEVRRISPEAPVPVVEVRRRTSVPGGAANVAVNVAALGGGAVLGSVVGGDPAADALADALGQGGVAADGLLRHPGRVTTTKTRVVAHSQQVVRMDWEERAPLTAPQESALLEWLAGRLARADACVLSDYAKGVATSRLTGEYVRLARVAGKPLVADPKGADYARYRGATVVKPNTHEVARLLGRDLEDEPTLLAAGHELAELLGDTAVLITRGPEGMSLFRRGRPPFHAPALARKVYDVTGAGDTVVAALALGLAAGATLEQAARLANHAAGVVVGKVGTATVSGDELEAALRS